MAARRKTSTDFPHHFWLVAAILLVLILSMYLLNKKHPPVPQTPVTTRMTMESKAFNFTNSTIMLNNIEMQFTNGIYRGNDQTDPGHTAQIMNRSVNPTETKAAAILVDNPGGSGTFYYLVGSSMSNGQEVYSTPIPLGDRIKIVSVMVDDAQAEDNGEITVEYLDRPTGAPMSIDPINPVTVKYSFEDNGNLIQALN